jgi:hypothetical protein
MFRNSCFHCNERGNGFCDMFLTTGAASYPARFLDSCVLTEGRRKGLDRDREKVR